MFKWHIQSALSRNRPIANDLKIVSDGIAASLRQFHASTSWADEGQPAPRKLRIIRTANATAELSSLKPSTPRAIDARSLAAAPPPTLRITREIVDSKTSYQSNRGGSFTPRGRGGFTPRGRGGFVPRGRGGFGGRGRGGASARGRGSAGGRRKKGRSRSVTDVEDEPIKEEPLSAEEKEYAIARDIGVERPAISGSITQAILESEIPGLATTSAPIGLVETIRDHIKKLTGRHGNEQLTAVVHAEQYNKRGTLFLNGEDKERVLGPEYAKNTPREYKIIDHKEREDIMKWLVAGQYPNLSQSSPKDVLGTVEAKANMNPSYLETHTSSLKAKVKELLPVLKPKKAAPKKVVRSS